jgi:hypothetical protein
MTPSLYGRRLQAGLLNALGDTPAVGLVGASRSGKSTLVLALRAALPAAAFHTFADPPTLAEATGDPAAFLKGLPALAFLDDVDRVPALVPLLRAALASGQRFLLTTPKTLPGLAEGLSSNLESFTLWPLAQAERDGVFPGLIDACFQGDPTRLQLEPLTRQELLGRVLAGGYPEVTDLTSSGRESWFHGYLASLVQGRLRGLTDLREVHHLIRLLAIPDADPGLAKRCRDLLEDVHVMAALPSGARAQSRWFNDSALQAHILGMAPTALETQPRLAAPLLETFAVMELVKTAPWSGSRPTLAHLRAGTQELIVLEDHRRQLVAFTVCAATTIQAEAFQGLQALRDRVGERLRTGVVLHAGGEPRAAGAGFWSLPFQALWAPRALPA